MMEEKWASIVGYEGYYEVSTLGNIRGVDRIISHPRLKIVKRRGHPIITRTNDKNGYVYVCLSKDGIKKQHRVHRLVIDAFSPIEHPEEFQVNHIDGVKHNNKLENLEWVTGSQNMIHAITTGLQPKPKSRKIICLSTAEVFDSIKEAAIKNGSTRLNTIIKVCTGKRSHYKGMRFAYYDDYLQGTIPEFSGKYRRRMNRDHQFAA